MLHQINELVDFPYFRGIKNKYCHENGRNAVPHIKVEKRFKIAQLIEKAKSRYKIEAKNIELKHRHGYETANSAGLFGMQMMQGTISYSQ